MAGYVLSRAFVLEAREGIDSLHSVRFDRRVFRNEVLDVHETATDSDTYLVALLNLDEDTSRAKFVHAFRFPKEHDLHLLLFRIVIDERG